MSSIEKRLSELGLSMGEAKPPIGNYLGCKQVGDILFAAALVSDCKGEVGTDVTLEEAKQAARNTVLAILAIIKRDIEDLNMIEGVTKLTGFVRSAANFTEQPKVIDGASELLITIFGESGRHARTATGVAQLPLGASVQLDIIFEMKKH